MVREHLRTVKLMFNEFSYAHIRNRTATKGASPASDHPPRIVIAAGAILDGRVRILHNTRLAIESSRIVSPFPKNGPVDYDLRGLTVLPGWIDAHVHIAWRFGKEGKNAGTRTAGMRRSSSIACAIVA